jgi:CheY-like chemotaxis protein
MTDAHSSGLGGARAPLAWPPGGHAAPPLRVLLLEPHPATAAAVRKQLQRCAYQVVSAASQGEALAALAAAQEGRRGARPFTIVLADAGAALGHAAAGGAGDHDAPGLQGLQAAAAGAPVVLMGEGSCSSDMAAALDAGAADYLSKPLVHASVAALRQHAALGATLSSGCSSGDDGASGSPLACQQGAGGGAWGRGCLAAADPLAAAERTGSAAISTSTALALSFGGADEEDMFDPACLFDGGDWEQEPPLGGLLSPGGASQADGGGGGAHACGAHGASGGAPGFHLGTSGPGFDVLAELEHLDGLYEQVRAAAAAAGKK